MAVSSTNGFYQCLEKESPASASFWLYGSETFLIQDGLERICQKLFGTPRPTLSENLNYEIYYGSERDPDRVYEALTSLPFFSAFKLIVVKEVDQYLDKDFEKLLAAILKKDPSVTLVLISDKVDKRTKAFKKMEELCVVVEFQSPYERDLPQWIQYLAQQQKIQIGRAESQLLIALVGTDLMLIKNELMKITFGLEGRNRIEMSDIEKYSSRGKDENVFALSDLLANRATSEALGLLKKLLEQGQNSIAILSLIARHFRILVIMTEGRRLGLGSAEIMARVKLPQFSFKKYWEQSQKWKPKALAEIQLMLAKTDKSLKSSPLAPSLVLENLVLSIPHR